MKAIYLGIAREIRTESGIRVRLLPGCTVRGELAAWLMARWPEQFRDATTDPPRLTVDVKPGDYVTKA